MACKTFLHLSNSEEGIIVSNVYKCKKDNIHYTLHKTPTIYLLERLLSIYIHECSHACANKLPLVATPLQLTSLFVYVKVYTIANQ